MTHPDEDLDFEERLEPDQRDIEAPDHDAVEQAITANPAEMPDEVHRGLEVGEWDAVEQAMTIDLDDDYR